MLEALHNSFFPYRDMPADLSDCTVTRDPERPWLIEIVEPLPTDAPGNAAPMCCFLQTVIFYEGPPRLLPDRGGYAVHDTVETRLMSDDVVRFEGELFECQLGRVTWDGTRWVLTKRARLVEGN